MDEAPAEDVAPDQKVEEGPSNNVSNPNEDQNSSPQDQQQQRQQQQQQHPNANENPMSPQWTMQLPPGPPMINGQAMPLPVGPGNPTLQLQFYEAQMRDHAAAYASAAAAAAMTAAQIASNIASSSGAPYNPYQQPQHVVPMSPMHFAESPQMYQPPPPMHQNFGPPYHHQPWMETSSHSSPFNGSNHSSEGNPNDTDYHQRRRKRQQRNPSFNFRRSDIHNRETVSNGTGGFVFGNGGNRSQQSQQKRGRRRRRFWNDAGSSDSGDPSSNRGNNSNEESNGKHCRRTRKMAKPTSSSSESGSASWITKKKQRQPNDDSLLGKTGVSALYEWCTKRRTTPTFSMTQSPSFNNKKDSEYSENEIQEPIESEQHAPKGEEGKRRRLELEHDFFETTVSIDGTVMGTGRGRTKTSAKHDASRRALLTLLPGVEFDEDSGILIRLPSQGSSHVRMQQKMAAINLEDLAPNLAKHLAIGHSNDDDKHQGGRNDGELPSRDSRKRQKWPHVYPGTSTTSDDEDENSYYASRGAYVCSSLLHAMVQIDERLTEPPEFTYQVSAITNEAGGQHLKLKRKAGVPIDATSTAFPRGTFECTGILKLRIDPTTPVNGDDSFDETPQPRECYRLLRSSGVGGTKREARHTAAAKLLAMLFPECDGMADVKQAAEEARERYAASRALKQQSKRESLFTGSSRSKNGFSDIHSSDRIVQTLMFGRVPANTPALPEIMKNDFLCILGGKCSRDKPSSEHEKGNGIESLIEAGLVRQLSRQQQLEEKTDLALLKLNEQDDEGRSLPEKLTADDVGRTVLRRARANDMVWVEKLFRTKSSPQSAFDSSPLFETILVSDKEPSSKSMRLWSSSTIVLLLCRAIAPHEDPPLGCAVITVGFSLQKGKTLRIAQIASKKHQPKERFIETLSLFAKNMDCSLITSTPKSAFATLDNDHIERLVDPDSRPYPSRQDGSKLTCDTIEVPTPREGSFVISSLQAVQEEGEGVDESDSSSAINEKAKRREKPSKRSRFQ